MSKPSIQRRDSTSTKPPIVEVLGEAGDSIEPPPPEVLEPDPELTPEQAEQARKSYLLTRFWITAKGFWGKSGDRLAWMFSIGLLVLIVANVGVQYGINLWNRAIFDAIEKRDSATVFHLSAVFFPLAIGSVALGVAQVFARMGIQRRWRAWVTNSVVSRWLTNGRYYQLNLVSGDHQNPEYRIAEDLRIATDLPVDFVGRGYFRIPFGRDLHRGALDDRRRADRYRRRDQASPFPASWSSRRCSTPRSPSAR